MRKKQLTGCLLSAAILALSSSEAGAVSICIDPGHGGSDPGAMGCGLKEAVTSLDISLKLRDLMRAAGYTVYMTRESDIYVELSARAAYANAKGVDTFVSIHHNSFDGNAHGLETYCFTGCLGGGSGFNQASKIQSQMLAAWPLTNRGVKDANFAVLRETSMTATLSEVAFIDNCGGDANYIQDAGRRMDAARAHCKALTSQWGGNAAACSGGGTTPPSTSTGKVMAGTFKNSLEDTSETNWLSGVKFTIGGKSQTSAATKILMSFEVPVGKFKATASKDGYETITREDCKPAAAGQISWCSIALKAKQAKPDPPAKGKLSGAVMDGSSNAKIAAKIVVNGATINYDGKTDWVSGDLDPKAYTVEATADGYDKTSTSCTVASGKTTGCPITLHPKKGTITGNVFDKATEARIAASVTLGGIKVSTTETQKFEFSVNAGTHTISASAPGYEPANKSCSVEKGKTATCDIGLDKTQENPGTVNNGMIVGTLSDSVSKNPIPGKVSIQNVQDFTCGATGKFLFHLKPGSYQLTGSAEGYSTETVPCTVTPDQKTTCDIALNPGKSKVTGTVFDASTKQTIAATVTIEGNTIQYDGKTDWSVELLPGSYNLTATADGYQSGSSLCTVAAGKPAVCEIALIGEGVETGSLSGVVYNVDGDLNQDGVPLLPLKATVYVKGFDPTTSADDGRWEVKNLPVASYQVTAKKDGYYSKTVTCNVVAGESAYCPIALRMEKSDSGSSIDAEAPTLYVQPSDDCSSTPIRTPRHPLALIAAALGLLTTFGIRRRNSKGMK